ncbi:MAG TPA: flagellar export protein FliJ [Bacillales bacterium]|nr:flagellar export protein FliJ [Bacillales bacterium]
MSFQFTLQKLLTVKENEKQHMERSYQKAYANFEKIAQTLYTFLKQKETIERLQAEGIQQGAVIGEIQKWQSNLDHVQKEIDHFQPLFQMARQEAERSKASLIEKSIDVKRYEKLKKLEYEKFLKKRKAEEMAQMDELSTTRFAHR